MSEPTTWICGLCSRILDEHVVREADGTEVSREQRHTIGDEQRVDHEAMPVRVPLSQANLRCDFCHDDVGLFSAYTLHTGDVVIVAPGAGPNGMDESFHMGTEWCVDEPCADLIRKGKWKALFKRGMDGYERRHVQPVDAGMRAFMQVIYTKVEQNVVQLDPPITPKEAL